MNRDVSYAQVLSDYVATKDRELTVLKGDIVQLLGCSGQTHRICRKTNDQSLIVDGLLPSHVLMLKDITDNGFRYVLLADSCIRGHYEGECVPIVKTFKNAFVDGIANDFPAKNALG